MAERDKGPEPDGNDRPSPSGVPADSASSMPDTLPRRAAGTTGAGTAAVTGLSPLQVASRRGQRAADLRQKLDEKAAATDELREALDELRQVLDVDNPPPAAGSARRRTRFLVLGGVLVAVLALVLWLLLDRGSSSIVADTPAPGSPTTATGPSGTGVGAVAPSASGATSGASASSTATASGASIAVQPLPWPGGAVTTPPGLTTTGPGAGEPGTDVQVAVDPDGVHLDVFERLVLDAPSSDVLSLAAPTLPALSATAHVENLQVQLDDTPVAVTADGPTSWSAAAPSGSFTRVVLRYRMAAGVVFFTPAAPGRALGIVTPLTGMISVGHGLPVQVRSTDPHVIGISCPTAPTGAVCGNRTADGWTATVPADSARMIVLLQLNTKR